MRVANSHDMGRDVRGRATAHLCLRILQGAFLGGGERSAFVATVPWQRDELCHLQYYIHTRSVAIGIGPDKHTPDTFNNTTTRTADLHGMLGDLATPSCSACWWVILCVRPAGAISAASSLWHGRGTR